MPQASAISAAMQRCIDACSECGDTCNSTVAHCLHLGGEHAEASHIALLLTSADMCESSARAMLRRADVSGAICGLCAEICRLCAADCDRYDACKGVLMITPRWSFRTHHHRAGRTAGVACALTLAFATLAGELSAQWSRVYDQFYLPASHNWQLRHNYPPADRLFNGL